MDHLVCQRNDSVFNASQRPLEKTHQVVWDSFIDCGRLKRQRILHDLEEALDVAYEDVPHKIDLVWCVEGLVCYL